MHKYTIRIDVYREGDLPQDLANGGPIRQRLFSFEVVKESYEESQKTWKFLTEECSFPNCTISLFHLETSMKSELKALRRSDGTLFLPEGGL